MEIWKIIPPKEFSNAKNRQMSAEPDRRAQVTSSTDQKEATIILTEGNKTVTILEAEGQRQPLILCAEGYVESLNQFFDALEKIDQNAIKLQYSKAFKEIGNGASIKYVIPMEFTSKISNFF